MASFIMMLLSRNMVESTLIISIIDHFQNNLIELIEIEGKNLECEEISEIIFIFVSLGNSIPILTLEETWNNTIIPNIIHISKLKVKEHCSLSSRIIFKQLDLKDFITNQNNIMKNI